MKTHTTGFRVVRPPWWSLVPIIQTFPYMTSIISHISRSFSSVFARVIYICNLYSHSTTLHNGITALKVTHVIKRFVVLFAWFMHVCVRKRMCLCVCKYLQICMCMCVCVCVFTAIWSEERTKIHSNYPSPVAAVLVGSVSWLCPWPDTYSAACPH